MPGKCILLQKYIRLLKIL